MHVQFGDYHVRDIEFVAAFDVDAKKVGFDLAEAITASENNTIKICDVPPTGVTVQRGHTLDGLGKYYRETIDESDDEPVDVVAGAARTPRPTCSSATCPSGSEDAAKFYAQCAIDAGVAFVNALPVFIAVRPRVGQEVRGRRRADRRRRHQVAGRRHHHPPRAGQAVRGPRRRARPHLPAQRRRQHGLQEHARARAPGVQEDLQDPGRHLQHRPRPGRAQRAHRPVGLRRRGSTTASGPTSGSRVARSATCR